jgi:hypothetical protein
VPYQHSTDEESGNQILQHSALLSFTYPLGFSLPSSTEPLPGIFPDLFTWTSKIRSHFFCLYSCKWSYVFSPVPLPCTFLFNDSFKKLFWWDWGLNSGLWACKAGALLLEPHLQATSSGHFGDEVLQTICPGWSQTSNLLFSAYQVARIIGASWYLHIVLIFIAIIIHCHL